MHISFCVEFHNFADHFKLCPALVCREDAACILITQQQQKDKSKYHVQWFDLKKLLQQLYKKNNL
ncbi:hypothetical protein T05_14757 [Trichinella murrelli]|uniref:Uncharacterized protein n=1 Tax=Trichinella murrelli TaxID=144512 RepID=A0A0V0U2T3_9BILA|nr:hypothetical protein T05_14757 [Trichinella murrelli]